MRALKSLEVIAAIETTISQGSPLKAARALGCAPSTIYRAIDRIEKLLGVPLFVRDAGQWRPTPAAERIKTLAEHIDDEIRAAESHLLSLSQGFPKHLRISASDGFAEGYLGPIVAEFTRQTPGISVEIAVENHFADLKRFEADIAIRPDQKPGDALVGRRAGRLAHALYAAESLIASHGLPTGLEDLARFPVCSLTDKLAHFTAAAWWRSVPAAKIANRAPAVIANTEMALTSAVAGGAGLGVLPCHLGARPGLVRVPGITVGQPVDIWLVTTPTLRTNTTVRAFMTALAAAMKRDRGLLAGEPTPP